MITALLCEQCGAQLSHEAGSNLASCSYCGTTHYLGRFKSPEEIMADAYAEAEAIDAALGVRTMENMSEEDMADMADFMQKSMHENYLRNHPELNV